MSRRGISAALLFAGAVGVARSEVLDVAENGFTIRDVVTVNAPPAKAWTAMVAEVSKWWDPAHTFSQFAGNLSIEAKPQGCFCERLPGQGGVRHLTVVYVAPGKQIRFAGGLGPLQAMGVSGSMSWTIQSSENGSSIEVKYVVGGYNPGGFKDLAPGVDSVIRAQFERLKRYVETGKP